MCGIAGIFSFNDKPVKIDLLKKMTDVITHRGPDGEGHWINSDLKTGFGHRRLSIIDLSNHASQPMHYLEGRYTITFNGEIYNYIEIKKDLISKGYKFMSESDTEVLLALYDLKKEKCLNDLDGMFSFAIWDEKEKVLFCARDRFGEKPFHYFTDGKRFIFASEIKQFWPIGIQKEISETKIQTFIETGHIDSSESSQTFYNKILRLDAAHYLKIDAIGKIIKQKYWELETRTNHYKGSFEEARQQFLELFTTAVHLRLRSDVPVGSSLSGGLDSSSIVMLIDKLKGDTVTQNSFSARFKNFSKDEGQHIETVVKACKNVKEHFIWPDENYFFENLEKVIHCQDEPFGSASIVAQWSVMELARKNNVTVLLDGQGADEYLAGYIPHSTLYLDQLFYNNKILFKEEVENFKKIHGSTFNYIPLNKRETTRMKLGRYKRKLLKQEMPISPNGLSKQLQSETTGSLQILLRYADRNSMAHSREVRLPFLSHKLVEFAFSLPDSYKLNQGWTKFILRKAMENTLPKSICWRADKIGYEPPQNAWMNTPHMLSEVEKACSFLKVPFVNDPGESYLNSRRWRLLMAYKYAS